MVARCVNQTDRRLLLRTLAKGAGTVRCVFVGDGPLLPELQAQARELGIAERVDFVGRRFDVAQILSKAHIFALPTHWDFFFQAEDGIRDSSVTGVQTCALPI